MARYNKLLFLICLVGLIHELYSQGSSAIDPTLGIYTSGNYVNDFTGQVAFPINLATISNFGGLSYAVNLNYYGGGVQEKYLEHVRYSPNSWVGLGFGFGAPKITADMKGTSNKSDDTYYLFLDGQTPIELDFLEGSTNYVPKNDPTILLTNFAGANHYWTLELPTGAIYTFGNKDIVACTGSETVQDARMCSHTNGPNIGFGGDNSRIPDAWYVKTISDVNQEFFIEFIYDKIVDESQLTPEGLPIKIDRAIYLSSINTYVTSNPEFTLSSIQFHREEKQAYQFYDPTSLNIFSRYERDRLDSLSLFQNQSSISSGSYKLHYFNSPQMLLQNITFYDPVFQKPRHYAQFEYLNRVASDGTLEQPGSSADGRLESYIDADGRSITYSYRDNLFVNPQQLEQIFTTEFVTNSRFTIEKEVELMHSGREYFYFVVREEEVFDPLEFDLQGYDPNAVPPPSEEDAFIWVMSFTNTYNYTAEYQEGDLDAGGLIYNLFNSLGRTTPSTLLSLSGSSIDLHSFLDDDLGVVNMLEFVTVWQMLSSAGRIVDALGNQDVWNDIRRVRFNLYTFKQNSTYLEYKTKANLYIDNVFTVTKFLDATFSISPNEDYLIANAGNGYNHPPNLPGCKFTFVFDLNAGEIIDETALNGESCGDGAALFEDWFSVYNTYNALFYYKNGAGDWVTFNEDPSKIDGCGGTICEIDINIDERGHGEHLSVSRNQNQMAIAHAYSQNSEQVDKWFAVVERPEGSVVQATQFIGNGNTNKIYQVGIGNGFVASLHMSEAGAGGNALRIWFYENGVLDDAPFDPLGGLFGGGDPGGSVIQVAGNLVLLYDPDLSTAHIYKIDAIGRQASFLNSVSFSTATKMAAQLTSDYVFGHSVNANGDHTGNSRIYLRGPDGKYETLIGLEADIESVVARGNKLYQFDNPLDKIVTKIKRSSINFDNLTLTPSSDITGIFEVSILGKELATARYSSSFFDDYLRIETMFAPRNSTPHAVQFIDVNTKGNSSSFDDGTTRRIAFGFSGTGPLGAGPRPVALSRNSDIPNFAYIRKSSLEGKALIEFHRDYLDETLVEDSKQLHGRVKKQWFFPKLPQGAVPSNQIEDVQFPGGRETENEYVIEKLRNVQGRIVPPTEDPLNVPRQIRSESKQYFFDNFTKGAIIYKDFDPLSGSPRISISESGDDYLVAYTVFKHNLEPVGSMGRHDLVGQVSQYRITSGNPCLVPSPTPEDPCPSITQPSLNDPQAYKFQAVVSTYTEYDADELFKARYIWRPTVLGADPQNGNTLDNELSAPPTSNSFWQKLESIEIRNDEVQNTRVQNFLPTLVSTPTSNTSIFYGGFDGLPLGQINNCNYTYNCAILTGEEFPPTGLGPFGRWDENGAVLEPLFFHTGEKSIKVTAAYGPIINLHLGQNQEFISREKGMVASFWIFVTGNAVPDASVSFYDNGTKVDFVNLIEEHESKHGPVPKNQWVKVQHHIPFGQLLSYTGVDFSDATDYIRYWAGKSAQDASADPIYVDDMRIHPADAVAVTRNYDSRGRVTSVLDAQNEPGFYKYDVYGRPVGRKNTNGLIYNSSATISLGEKVQPPAPAGVSIGAEPQTFYRPNRNEEEHCFTPIVSSNIAIPYTLSVPDGSPFETKGRLVCINGPHTETETAPVIASIFMVGEGAVNHEFNVTIKGFVLLHESSYSYVLGQSPDNLEKECANVGQSSERCAYKLNLISFTQTLVDNNDNALEYVIWPGFNGISGPDVFYQNIQEWRNGVNSEFHLKYGFFEPGGSYYAGFRPNTEDQLYLSMAPCNIEHDPIPSSGPEFSRGSYIWPAAGTEGCLPPLPLSITLDASEVASGLRFGNLFSNNNWVAPSNILYFQVKGRNTNGDFDEPINVLSINMNVKAYGYR